jgi:hypothetical protein
MDVKFQIRFFELWQYVWVTYTVKMEAAASETMVPTAWLQCYNPEDHSIYEVWHYVVYETFTAILEERTTFIIRVEE